MKELQLEKSKLIEASSKIETLLLEKTSLQKTIEQLNAQIQKNDEGKKVDNSNNFILFSSIR